MDIKISPFSDNKSLHLGAHRVSFVELKVTSAVSNYSTANTSKNIPYIAYDYYIKLSRVVCVSSRPTVIYYIRSIAQGH